MHKLLLLHNALRTRSGQKSLSSEADLGAPKRRVIFLPTFVTDTPPYRYMCPAGKNCSFFEPNLSPATLYVRELGAG